MVREFISELEQQGRQFGQLVQALPEQFKVVKENYQDNLQLVLTDDVLDTDRTMSAVNLDSERVDKLVSLLEEAIGDEPFNNDEMGGCLYCGGPPSKQEYGYAGANPADHREGCGWVKCRQYLDDLYLGQSADHA